jgi:hypothetical protein
LAYLQAMVALESAGLPGLNYAPRNETTAGIENRARTYGAGLARSCTGAFRRSAPTFTRVG